MDEALPVWQGSMTPRSSAYAWTSAGVPNSAEARAEMAMLMITTAMEHDIMPERLFLDPLVLPTRRAQDQGRKVIEAVQMFQTLERTRRPAR